MATEVKEIIRSEVIKEAGLHRLSSEFLLPDEALEGCDFALTTIFEKQAYPFPDRHPLNTIY
ncbi:MAG: hypothetical protein ACFB5Z_12505 [Elainellaceae cyanobacterium]